MTGWLAFGLLAGVLAALAAWNEGFAFPALSDSVLALIAVLVLIVPLRKQWRSHASALRPLAAACVGALLAGQALRDYAAHRLAPAQEERLLAVARVEGLPERRGDLLQFTALLSPLRPGDALLPGTRAALRWQDAPALRPGESWQLLVSLHAPPSAANPGSSDQALQSLRLRLHAAGQVIASPLDVRLSAGRWQLDRLRARISAWIHAETSERDSAALLAALAVGDTQHVSQEQWRVFNAVGITHLVAISGMHVTAFSLVAGWLAAHAWRRWHWLQPRVRRSAFAAFVGLAAATGYALLAGWSVPTQRTLLMLACWHGLHAIARRRTAATTLAAGLAGVLLLDPLAPLAPGFWLSFLAVGSLLVAGALAPLGHALPKAGAWRAMLREQAWVAAALLPVTVAVFGSVSLAGLLVNLAAIPFFSFALVPLVLAATAGALLHPLLGLAPLKLAAWLASHAWPMLSAAANAPLALWRVQPEAWWYLLAAAALVVLFLPWPGWVRASALLVLLPLAWPLRQGLADGEFAVTVFDAGGGEATLLRTSRHALLYDDGEVHGSAGSYTARVLVPALRHYGLVRIDRVLLPALDGDRGAGIAALDASLAAPPAVWVAASVGQAQALPPEVQACAPGTHWQWDGVDFAWLAGEGCALRVASGAAAMLLPGGERAAGLRDQIASALPPTPIVLVPGQGARTAHAPALLRAASARLALLAGTPRAATRASVAASITAWCATGAAVLVTGATGAVEIRARPDGAIRIAMPRRAQVSCSIGRRAE